MTPPELCLRKAARRGTRQRRGRRVLALTGARPRRKWWAPEHVPAVPEKQGSKHNAGVDVPADALNIHQLKSPKMDHTSPRPRVTTRTTAKVRRAIRTGLFFGHLKDRAMWRPSRQHGEYAVAGDSVYLDVDGAVLGTRDEAEEAGEHVGEDEEEEEDVGPGVAHGGSWEGILSVRRLYGWAERAINGDAAAVTTMAWPDD